MPTVPDTPTPEAEPSLMPLERQYELATYAELLDRPSSPEAIALCDELLTDLLRDRQPRPPRNKQREAFGGLIADLLHRDPMPDGGWVYRAVRPNGFTGEAVGYDVFRFIAEAMVDGSLVWFHRGSQRVTKSEFTGGTWQVTGQRASRFRASDSLRLRFAERGISHTNWADHFSRDAEAAELVERKRKVHLILRGPKPPKRARAERRSSLPVDLKDPEVEKLNNRLVRLNDYLRGQTIEPFGPRVQLQRIFANDELRDDHGWKQGGRFYATGSPNYQTENKGVRKTITINGLPSVELDI
ncbi:hypothetical protein GCM10011371_27690 [Novosphingobium marinum]|uniref:Uncharacterized protein n=1 Tax=Novosphingobium marinum TaxID=1514948 RepID=A0A7Y9XU72_9SPHN|nr:hypothetical protein [Novosphingobium marinum]NYH94615.1 hypothetical protein [Novosphingobium marinum]GGC38724.1 hypothetical protein GCM10011371_27690 [Novosphingobium marinum]